MNLDKNILLNRFSWLRKNTINLFKTVTNKNDFLFKPHYKIESSQENHNLLYQFQCILTTADTYLRKLNKNQNTKFGIIIKKNQIVKKSDIRIETIEELLNNQIEEVNKIFDRTNFNKKEIINTFISLVEHEYLHQGQLVVMFRLIGLDFPKEFKRAWNL